MNHPIVYPDAERIRKLKAERDALRAERDEALAELAALRESIVGRTVEELDALRAERDEALEMLREFPGIGEERRKELYQWWAKRRKLLERTDR